MLDEEITQAARGLVVLCMRKKLRIVLAESCTGGLVAAALTEIAGASEVLERGYVTYSNAAKQQLGVPVATLQQYGAVSRATAEAMATAALANVPADMAAAITGIAGPGGGTAEKPVGLVHFAAVRRGGGVVHQERQFGDIGRGEVRRRSVLQAIAMLSDLAGSGN